MTIKSSSPRTLVVGVCQKINIILNKLGLGQRHHIYAIAIKIGGDEN
jgi:hypothetical protein